MKRFKTYRIICLLVVCWLTTYSCKKRENPLAEPTLQGLWQLDTRGSQYHLQQMLFRGDSVFQSVGSRFDSVPTYKYYAKGTYRILPDTSFLNIYDSVIYAGKNLKIDMWKDPYSPQIMYGVFKLTTDSLVIHTYCCYTLLRFYRIK